MDLGRTEEADYIAISRRIMSLLVGLGCGVQAIGAWVACALTLGEQGVMSVSPHTVVHLGLFGRCKHTAVAESEQGV